VPLIIGTSGWQYRHWRGSFYPRGIAQSKWLEFYAARFATVESNAAFYRLPEQPTFADWAARTPPDFTWAVKVSRFLTHVKRLREPAEPVERFVSHARGLGEKLGPVLVQLPPQLSRDDDRLEETLAHFPNGMRVAVEFRHKSWWSAEVRRILERHGTALCWADRFGPHTPLWRTADFAYLRFHQGRARPAGCYGRQALSTWIERIDDVLDRASDVYAYFNNDGHTCAPANAVVLAHLAERAGLPTTRVPPRAEVPVA
jgi:uncharacterized protein YecE (DUF72 family)